MLLPQIYAHFDCWTSDANMPFIHLMPAVIAITHFVNKLTLSVYNWIID